MRRRDVVGLVGPGGGGRRVRRRVADCLRRWSPACRTRYLLTQAAWRGRAEVVPLLPWVDVARFLVDDAWPLLLLSRRPPSRWRVVLSPPARRLGPELWTWTAAYGAYLVGVVEPGTSLVRFGLLAFPLAAVVAGAVTAPGGGPPGLARRGARGRASLGQVAWTWGLWRLTPPSGWPP